MASDDLLRLPRPHVPAHSRLRPDHTDVYDTVVLESDYNALVQAIFDPENQPSQYGTVTLAYHEAECEGLRQDAERYRWLRCNTEKNTPSGYHYSGHISYPTMDAAIDAAIAARKP